MIYFLTRCIGSSLGKVWLNKVLEMRNEALEDLTILKIWRHITENVETIYIGNNIDLRTPPNPIAVFERLEKCPNSRNYDNFLDKS